MRVKSSQDPFVVVHHSPSLNVGAADRGDWGYPPCAQLATADTPSAAGTAFLTEHHSTDFILRLSQRPARVQDVVSVTGHLILGVLICSSATAGNMPKFPGALI